MEVITPIAHKNIKRLEKAMSKVKNKIPVDDFSILAKGYFDVDKEEYHIAPMFHTLKPCKEIVHDSYEDFVKALKNCQFGKRKVYPYEDVKRLMLGFVVHPEREVHLVSIRDVRNLKEFETPESRKQFFSYNI